MKTLSLVVPCRNEFRRLLPGVFLEATARWPWLSFCFVDDGSTDATAERLAWLSNASPSMYAIYLHDNLGKAEAVRTGIRHLCELSRADLVGFWDADLATPLDEIPRFVQCFESDTRLKAVIGSRWPHLGSEIRRSAKRGVAGLVVKALIRRILKAPVWDTQCGAKVFDRETAAEIFADPFQTQWLFDVELLARLGCDRLRAQTLELPVSSWRDVPGSNIGVWTSFAILRELALVSKVAIQSRRETAPDRDQDALSHLAGHRLQPGAPRGLVHPRQPS